MATLNDLPPEIIYQMFPSSSLREQFSVTNTDADLAKRIQPAWSSALNLSRTCRKYRHMLVPELYRNISIHGSNSFQKLKCFIQFLIDNKDVAVNIRRLYLHLDPSNMETKDFTEADLEWSHWAARQSGAPSPYYLWHSEDGQLLQMSESRCSRTRILHLGILLEIILSRVHGVQELGLAVPGGLFCDQYGPWSRTELDGLLWTGEPGPSDPLKIQTFRGVQRPLPNIKMLAVRPSCLPKSHPDATITPLDLNHLLHFAPNARSIFIASRDGQPASPLDTHSQWSNVTCLTITETFLDERKIRGMIQGCASLVSFKYLNSRADAYVPHWPVSPEEVVTILREHQNTTTTLLTLCLDLNDWYRGEYEAIRSLSDFSNLESLWVDASSVLKKVKYGSSSRSEKHKRLTHKLSTSLPASIKRLHLAGNEHQVRHNMCEVLTDREKFPNLRLVELEDFVRRFPELWDPNEDDSDEDDTDQNDLGDDGDDLAFSIMNAGDGYGGGSYLQDGDAKEEDIGETNKDTTLSYQEQFIRAGIESPSAVCTLGELW
ncbi:hypothetical protein CABS01_00844 [Colletotrichum abscissum]|uniref:Leucine-rich repeat domain-containing protein n=1 Tax=Colletotrichum abscissum TaxID=1671311 RepID=A0A9Q0B868_9PEZI|nr:uncharacterized protein CABS01_00844 [Colletotrichum abscissum]KAI3556743.1 hypothetical protein CABS02_03184 [Colletotrichum abscissum]KAK1505376.1 hypothetical protein CABS01_00844 [Colletotrichum abscissum]